MADMNENKEVLEEESLPVKKEAQKPAKKGPNAFVRFFKKIGKFFRDIWSELKKVVWTPKSDVKKNTILVVVSVVLFAAAIFVVDVTGGFLVELLAKLIK